MIPAQKSKLINALIYRLLVVPGLQSNFHAVHYRQAEPVATTDAPCIFVGNHSAWWDAHLPMVANETRWQANGYVMVEDTQLRRYGFFRYVGAFSVNRHDGRSAMESLNYAVEKLVEAPRRMLLIFPQGEILANDTRPLSFFSGTGRIVKKVVEQRGGCDVYPMALRYEFIGEQKPDAFMSIGPTLRYRSDQKLLDAREVTSALETAVTHALDQLRADITGYRFDTFTPLVKGRWSINRMWDAVRGKGQIKQVGGV